MVWQSSGMSRVGVVWADMAAPLPLYARNVEPECGLTFRCSAIKAQPSQLSRHSGEAWLAFGEWPGGAVPDQKHGQFARA
jgi:hypothetical protein